MSQRYNDSTKRPKSKKNQLGILKFMHFARKFGRQPQVQERVLLGLLSIYKNTLEKLLHLLPKSYCNFTYLVVDGRAQIEHRCHIVKVSVEANANTSSPDIYWRKCLSWQAHLELCHRNHENLERMLNWITLSNSIAEKCPPTQVIKQPEHGRTSTTKEKNWSSFQTNYD